MRKSRFSNEQITQILAESRAGVPTAELCRKHGVSGKTFCGWRARYGGMAGTELRRMKELEASRTVIRGKW
jgi:putative transposase